jgi:hypothetical protein
MLEMAIWWGNFNIIEWNKFYEEVNRFRHAQFIGVDVLIRVINFQTWQNLWTYEPTTAAEQASVKDFTMAKISGRPSIYAASDIHTGDTFDAENFQKLPNAKKITGTKWHKFSYHVPKSLREGKQLQTTVFPIERPGEPFSNIIVAMNYTSLNQVLACPNAINVSVGEWPHGPIVDPFPPIDYSTLVTARMKHEVTFQMKCNFNWRLMGRLPTGGSRNQPEPKITKMSSV